MFVFLRVYDFMCVFMACLCSSSLPQFNTVFSRMIKQGSLNVSCGTYWTNSTFDNDQCKLWFLKEDGSISDHNKPTNCWKPSNNNNSIIEINGTWLKEGKDQKFDFQPKGFH